MSAINFAVPDTLRSTRVLYAAAVTVSFTLLVRAMVAFQPPKPISSRHSLRDARSSDSVDRLRELYPEDLYPGGAYFRGPFGSTHYFVLGGGQGPKVVLIHGLAIPALAWKLIAPQLAERGYQVLVYDLYGRGYSDAPDVSYTTALYTTQLALLMQNLRWDKASIVGLSMGGAVAAAMAADYPHLVDGQVVLCAPAGLIQPENIPSSALLLSTGFIQKLLNSSPFKHLFGALSSPRHFSSTGLLEVDAVEQVVPLQTAALSGYTRALASSLRDGPLTGLEWAFARMGCDSNIQVLHLHGTRDLTIPYSTTVNSIAAFVPIERLQHLALDGAGHNFCYDPRFAPLIVEAIAGFLPSRSRS